MKQKTGALLLTAMILFAVSAAAQTGRSASEAGSARQARTGKLEGIVAGLHPAEGNYIARDFRFQDGQTMPALRLHYTTLGRPHRNARGRVTNAVLFLHGTGGSGHQFLSPQFAGVLFGPGELLDASRYYIILPDDIGHGHSSKPSDGLRMKFPHYDYADMVHAEHLLVTHALGVNHLRLIGGTSMGCMHTWMWAEDYPNFMDAALPLACLPIQISGRNRIIRRMIMDDIRDDPAWNGGNYTAEPKCGLRGALGLLFVLISSPLHEQKVYPTQAAADRYAEQFMKAELARVDANDMLYQWDSSRDYDPSARLGEIKTWVMYINSADDQVNPPELGIAQREIRKVKHGTFVLLPITSRTRGHGTHSLPAIWKQYLAKLLTESRHGG
jgi:homoserine O-acetyltransferase